MARRDVAPRFLNRQGKILIALFKFTRWLCALGAGFSIALMFGIIFVNSVRRYTIGKSFEWGEELPIYLGIYGLMFGAALAYLQDKHIRFTILLEFLSEQTQKRMFAIVDLLVAASGAVLSYSGYLFVLRRGGVEAPGLIGQIRLAAKATEQNWVELLGYMAFWQSAMIVGGVLITLAGLLKFYHRTVKELHS